jgi:purine-binding chemotaxis protein CheW
MQYNNQRNAVGSAKKNNSERQYPVNELAVRAEENSTTEAEVQLVTARIDGQLFGFPILEVQDIVEPKLLTAVPLAPSAIGGVMNLRGRIVTVIDLRKCFGKIDEVDIPRHMGITIENHGDLYTLLVDEIGDVQSLANQDFKPAPATLDDKLKPLCSGVYRLAEELLVVLDVDRILDPETIARTPPAKFRRRRPALAIEDKKKVPTAPPEGKSSGKEPKSEDISADADLEKFAEKSPAGPETGDTGIPDQALEGEPAAISLLLEDAEPFEDKDLGCTVDIDAGGKEYGQESATEAPKEAPLVKSPPTRATVSAGVSDSDAVVTLDFLDAPMSENDAVTQQREAAARDLASLEEETPAEPQQSVTNQAPAMDPSAPIFDRIGGATAVAKAVEVLYDKLLSDTQLAGFYVALDLCRQLDVTNNFIAVALGGPDRGKGAGISVQQAMLGEPESPNDDHFDAWLGHLEVAFRDAGVADELIFESLAVLEKNREEAINA